jgi:PAS domain S-box-containing protein
MKGQAIACKTMRIPSELILSSAGEPVWVVDAAGLTTFVNPAAAQAAGWDADELLGRSQHSLLKHSNPEGKPFEEAECPLCRAFAEGREYRATEDTFWKRDGGSFPVEYRSTPIVEAGVTLGAVLTFRDVTEHRLLHSKLVQAQKLESIGQLAAGIAHEINTPIQFVGDNTRFLKDAFTSFNELIVACERLLESAEQGAADMSLVEEIRAIADAADIDYLREEVPKSIEQSLEGIGRVARIVRAMKDFSHPDENGKSSADVNRAIESTVTVARNEWKYVASLELDLDPDLPLVVCQIGALNQVILNLVVNAAHAIGDVKGNSPNHKGKITVSTRRDDDMLVIRIADTGAGIPPAARSKIFDPFFTTKPVGKGTGQGLAIAYSVVVEKHGGAISFESEVGRGTTFIIRLPINGEAATTASQRLATAGANA